MRLLVENVVGFEGSRTRARMVEVMQAAGYAVQVSAVETSHYDFHYVSLINRVTPRRVNVSQASCEHDFVSFIHQAHLPYKSIPEQLPVSGPNLGQLAYQYIA